MSQAWYYELNGEQRGPCSSSEIRKLAESQQITPNTQVRLDGTSDWVDADRIKGLFKIPPKKHPIPSKHHLFVRRDNVIHGPFLVADIKASYEVAKIDAEDLVSAGENGPWRKVQDWYGEYCSPEPPPFAGTDP